MRHYFIMVVTILFPLFNTFGFVFPSNIKDSLVLQCRFSGRITYINYNTSNYYSVRAPYGTSYNDTIVWSLKLSFLPVDIYKAINFDTTCIPNGGKNVYMARFFVISQKKTPGYFPANLIDYGCRVGSNNPNPYSYCSFYYTNPFSFSFGYGLDKYYNPAYLGDTIITYTLSKRDTIRNPFDSIGTPFDFNYNYAVKWRKPGTLRDTFAYYSASATFKLDSIQQLYPAPTEIFKHSINRQLSNSMIKSNHFYDLSGRLIKNVNNSIYFKLSRKLFRHEN